MDWDRIWLHFFDGVPEQFKHEVLASLVQARVQPRLLGAESPCGSGILFFDDVTSALLDFARDAARGGDQRVLAVACRTDNLARGCGWQILRRGASDVFSWDHSPTPLREIADRFDRWQGVDERMASPVVSHSLVGTSPAWTSVVRQVVEVAAFTDASILIMGETGTGKEMVARAIHDLDQRPHKGEFVVVDCTTVSPELAGSEFFGHERGAFTGAVGFRDGAFALADGGTLFLDEVGELPAPMQAQLLRVVQEHNYKRVGSNTWQHTAFRLVCATNRNLPDLVGSGGFRQDLYYRIAQWTCCLPPLRDRREDIVPLARCFQRQMNPEPPELDEDVWEYLLHRAYPGNVRDLRQTVLRIMYHHVGPGPLTVGDIPPDERPTDDSNAADWQGSGFCTCIRNAVALNVGLKEIGRSAEELAIQVAIEAEDGNLQRAARRLGVTDRTLQLRRAAVREKCSRS
jgi:transcriptional regulator with GAF, ATPase, and Fis domain